MSPRIGKSFLISSGTDSISAGGAGFWVSILFMLAARASFFTGPSFRVKSSFTAIPRSRQISRIFGGSARHRQSPHWW